MKRLLKTMVAVVLAACIVPASTHAKEAQKRIATEEEIENRAGTLAITESIGVGLGMAPALAAGMVANKKIVDLLAPLLSKHVATGIAIPGGMLAFWAASAVFQVPTFYLLYKYSKDFNKESFKSIYKKAEQLSGAAAVSMVVIIPALIAAIQLSATLTNGILSLA